MVGIRDKDKALAFRLCRLSLEAFRNLPRKAADRQKSAVCATLMPVSSNVELERVALARGMQKFLENSECWCVTSPL
jgi:hypothetical protein